MFKPFTPFFIISMAFVFSLLALFSTTSVVQADNVEIKSQESLNDIELFAKAVKLSTQHQWAQAEPIYRELIKRNSEWPEPANNLAILLLKTNRTDEAKKMFEQAVNSSPNYRLAQKNRSELYNFLATQAYDKALGAEQEVALPELALIETIYQPVKVIEVEIEKIVIQEKVVIQEKIVAAMPATEIIPSSSHHRSSHHRDDNRDGDNDANSNNDNNAVANQQLSERIKQQLIAWSRAWSQGNFEYYIQNYSEHFQPSNKSKTYTEWKSVRRAKLKFTQGVNVEIENVRVFIEPVEENLEEKLEERLEERLEEMQGEARREKLSDYVLVEFVQKYQSKTYQDKVLKQMYLHRQQSNWLILSERTIKTY